jgi:hypothetical protein
VTSTNHLNLAAQYLFQGKNYDELTPK